MYLAEAREQRLVHVPGEGHRAKARTRTWQRPVSKGSYMYLAKAREQRLVHVPGKGHRAKARTRTWQRPESIGSEQRLVLVPGVCAKARSARTCTLLSCLLCAAGVDRLPAPRRRFFFSFFFCFWFSVVVVVLLLSLLFVLLWGLMSLPKGGARGKLLM